MQGNITTMIIKKREDEKLSIVCHCPCEITFKTIRLILVKRHTFDEVDKS